MASTMLEELCKSFLRYASAITEQINVGSCWFKSLTGFKLCATTPNNTQQGVQTDATCSIQQCCELLASRELKQPRRQRQRERQKISKNETNNFSLASCFFVHFVAVVARLRCETAQFYVLWRTRLTQDNEPLFLFLNFDTVL